MNKRIPYGRQNLDEKDIAAVSKSLQADFLTTGSAVQEFEAKFSGFVGSKYAMVVSSGTAGLHLACLAGGLEPDEEIITTPMTFAATANCALYCGAKPVFADINPESGLINLSEIEKAITPKTKIILPVHYTGNPCEMAEIKRIAEKRKLVVIEDACHALGATYRNSKVGDCQYSDMAVFSFHPVKHITTGEGGVITTNRKDIYEKLLLLRNHGITKEKNRFQNKSDGDWYYEMQELGFNYRLTDFQCALGASQLKKINAFLKRRQEIAARYIRELKRVEEVSFLENTPQSENAYHLFVIKIKNGRRQLYDYLKEKGIDCQVHYLPLYWHPYYQKLGYKKGLCPASEEFYETILSLPIYPGLKDFQQESVIKSIGEFFKNA